MHDLLIEHLQCIDEFIINMSINDGSSKVIADVYIVDESAEFGLGLLAVLELDVHDPRSVLQRLDLG